MEEKEKPDYRCPECNWEGPYTDLKYTIVCNNDCCSEPVCPECGRHWPIDLSVHTIGKEYVDGT